MPVLLVIDDESLILDCFRFLFSEDEATIITCTSGNEGIQRFSEQRPDAVVVDVRLPDQSGLEVYRRLREIDGRVPVIFITGYGTAETAIEAMRLGAYEYVVKPLDPDPLRELLLRAFEISRLMRVPTRLAEAKVGEETSDILVGNCPAMQEVYKAIGRVAPQDVTVLILGESGTGKELVARAIYHHSNRQRGPFLAINCAAIPEPLLESELFGHERGSFTGAERKRIGKFEQCHHGTLFLDEIGDMTPLTQTKILRVLQDGQFERVGGNEAIKTDVRVIAATNRDLAKLIAASQFRQDLYYRLNVYTIQLPPLRDRIEDLPLLVAHFLTLFSRELRKDVRTVAPETMEILQSYCWPGNVRELQSVLKQAMLQATGPVLLPEFLPAPLRNDEHIPTGTAPSHGKLLFPELTTYVRDRLAAGAMNLHPELQALTDRILFLEVLKHTGNNMTQSARILGISRATLRTKLSTLGIAIERSSSVEEDEVA